MIDKSCISVASRIRRIDWCHTSLPTVRHANAMLTTKRKVNTSGTERLIRMSFNGAFPLYPEIAGPCTARDGTSKKNALLLGKNCANISGCPINICFTKSRFGAPYRQAAIQNPSCPCPLNTPETLTGSRIHTSLPATVHNKSQWAVLDAVENHAPNGGSRVTTIFSLVS